MVLIHIFPQLFPSNPDDSNCGVFTIARAEALLHANKLPSDSYIELRLRYIRMLMWPVYDEATSSRHLSPVKRKHSLPPSEEDHSAKKTQCMLLTIDPVLADSNNHSDETLIWETISNFGDEWGQFYNSNIATPGATAEDIYRVLGMVAAIGCPQVMADLVDTLQDTDDLTVGNNYTETALKLYTKAESNLVRNSLKMRYAAVYMYCRFEQLTGSIQEEEKESKQRRRRQVRRERKSGGKGRQGPTPLSDLLSNPTKKAASYALDQLTAEAYNIPVKALLKTRDYTAYKERIQKIKAEDRVACQLDVAGSHRVWILIPGRDMASPLDDKLIIKPTMSVRTSS